MILTPPSSISVGGTHSFKWGKTISKASQNRPMTHPVKLCHSLFTTAHTKLRIMCWSSCYTGSWAVERMRHSRDFTSLRLHTRLLTGDQYSEGVAAVCGCGSSNSKCHIQPELLSAPLQPPILKHTNFKVTLCVPVRCVRPSSCRPCWPSFW